MVRKEKRDQSLPDPKWLMPDALWAAMEPLLPAPVAKGPGSRGGRPRANSRMLVDAIFYVLRTGCQWKALPRCLAAGSTAHDYFQELIRAGVWEQLWRAGLEQYDAVRGIEWQWQSMDGQMSKAPLGARRLAPIPPTGPRAEPSAAC